jgi:ATP-dependent Clp protease ATP-binding subunit ClpA
MTQLDREFIYAATAVQSGLKRPILQPELSAALIDQTIGQMRSRLVGQDDALTKLGTALKSRAAQRAVGWPEAVRSLRPTWDDRPWACILAVGPTGTGKTETAKMLANHLFDGRIVFLNCSEVGPEAPHGTAMWTGSPPGYVGSDRGGVLTDALRRNQSGVILIDEIEKASPEAVQNVLIPLLGEGIVTDRNNGEILRTADYVIVCTSNIDVQPAGMQAIGFHQEQDDQVDDRGIFAALTRYLLPEVVGRFHSILLYRNLDLNAQWRIWSNLRQDLSAKIGLGTQILLDEPARRFIQERFLDQETGARAVCDLFREQVVPLVVGAKAGDAIKVTVRGERLVIASCDGTGTNEPTAAHAAKPD